MIGVSLGTGGIERTLSHWRTERSTEKGMGWDACTSSTASSCSSAAISSSSSSSPGGKRSRDPEEDVYLDNLHSQKRYLSEIMASSLNGLTVGDPLTENLMESPSRSETICNPRDEITSQYSPMSEDSDDARFYDNPLNASLAQSDFISNPTSPVSPHRYPKPSGFSSPNPYPLPGCTLAAVVCSHARHRGSESEGRFPSSPNDVCHTPDLRRAALLRSVQMRAHPCCPPAYELAFHGGQEQENMDNVEDDRTYSCIKSLDDEPGYRSPEQVADYVEDCASVEDNAESKLGEED